MISADTVAGPETRRGATVHRRLVVLLLLVLALSVPLRVVGIGVSLWLDEAWVANSILAPSVHDMLYYPHWLQSSPPLWLAAERLAVAVGGDSVVALRLLPIAYGILACALCLRAFPRLTTRPGVAAGFAVVAGNYWLLKYALQLKQYSGDVLASMVVISVGARVLQGPSPAMPRLGALLLTTLLPAFSLPALFWMPAVVILGCLVVDEQGHVQRRVALRQGLLVAAAGAVTSGATLWFISSQTSTMTTQWRGAMVSLSSPATIGWELASNAGSLLVPPVHPAAVPLGAVVAMLVAVTACLISTIDVWRRRPRRMAVALLVGLPAASALAASLLGRYPLLGYTRLIVWCLPSVALVVARAAESVEEWWPRGSRPVLERGLILTATIVCLGVPAALAISPRPQEGGGDAVRSLLATAAPTDCIYVHGGMWEQFQYYARGTSTPECTLWGNVDWPCCALETTSRATVKTTRTFEEDVVAARRLAGRRTLWLLLPGGDSGHWSAHLRGGLDRAEELAACGGNVAVQRFGQTQVVRATCDYAAR